MGIRRVLHIGFSFLLVFCSVCAGFPGGAGALTIEEEKKLGKKIFLEIEKSVELVRDPILQTFLDTMGRSLGAQVGPTSFEFSFHLIKSTEPNAYAIPGGYIFITTGLLVLSENEHEIAGVLSHEISHVMARHVARMIERSKRLNIGTMAAVIAGILLGGGGKASGAAATMAVATSEALALKYSREMEVEADQNSLQYVIKAGYDPKGMVTFLDKINKISLASAPKIPAYLSTHPITENRISLLENLIQIGPKPSRPFRSIDNFRKIKARAFVEERDTHVGISHFQSVVDANAEDIDGYYGLGLAYRKMGRLDKSLEALQQASLLAPNDPDLLREIGVVHFLSGRLDQAIESLEAMRSLSRNGADENEDWVGLYYLGRGYQVRGDFEKALPLFLNVHKEMPEFPDVYLNLGSVYGRMGQAGRSHYYFGMHFKLRGERNTALLHFRKASDLLDQESLERKEAQREIKELTGGK